MAKTESTLKNMLMTLLVIAIISGTSLGFVYKLTKDPIDQSKLAKQQSAIKEVVPEFNNDPAAEVDTFVTESGLNLKIFHAKKDGVEVGLAIETITNKGFSGEIKIMVGFLPDGSILNYRVLNHHETPGLGSKMDEWFRPAKATVNQNEASKPSFFKWLFGIKSGTGGDKSIIAKTPGKNNLRVSKDGGEIDAITAATISSRAFLDAVDNARMAYLSQKTKETESVTQTPQEIVHE